MSSMNDLNPKYVLIGVIWLSVFVFAVLMVIFGALADGLGGLMGGAAFLGAAFATGVLLNWGELPKQAPAQDSDNAKRKNDSSLDPLSLLTEEDIAELREDVKRALRLRLLEGQDGELGSLDALLIEQEKRSRR